MRGEAVVKQLEAAAGRSAARIPWPAWMRGSRSRARVSTCSAARGPRSASSWADDPVGAAQRLAERGGQRAAAALELGAGVVPVVGGQVGGDLGEPVALQQVVDDDEGGQVGLALLGQEVRQPDERVLVAELVLELVDAEHVVGGEAAALVERVVDDHPDRAGVGLEPRGSASAPSSLTLSISTSTVRAVPRQVTVVLGLERALVLEVRAPPRAGP